jgi:hypothetical protein
MRPAGEVRLAMIQAAKDIVAQMGDPKRGATLAELAAAAGSKCPIGHNTARRYVDNMRRSGALQIVGTRRVDYRNRPVAEYRPVDTSLCKGKGWASLERCMTDWTR